MKGKVLSWFTGSVRIQITGGFCERFLNLCAYHNIRLWNLESGKEGYEASLSLANFWKLKPLIHKCHIKIRTVEKCGAPFLLHRYRHRKLLFLSVFAAFALIFSLSFFIWDIEIDGNLSVTDEKITDYLRGEGIAQGIPKSSIDYKLLAARIRQSFPVMTWVSVKLQGTRLVISLQENTDTGLVQERTYGPSDLVSNVDGVVTQIITRTGTPLVAAGDEVQKGDLLVSGCIELVNDSAEVYGCRYVAADADIYVKTHLAYEDRIPLNQKEKVYSGKETSRILLEFGSLHLGIPFFKRPGRPYDTVTVDRQLRLMENFYLPVFFSRITLREYEIADKTWTPAQGKQQAESNLNNFLKKIQEKGVQIFQNNVKIETTDSVCTAKGTLALIEKAGKRVDIQVKEMQKEGTQTE